MRKMLSATAGLAALAGFLMLPSAQASVAAEDVDLVSCPLGVQSTTYTPGLTFTTPAPDVTVSSSGTLGACASTDLDHTAATYQFKGSGNLNCLGGNSTGTGKITWADPGTTPSRFTFVASIALRPDGTTVLVATGPVISGDYTGHTVVHTVVITSLDLLACATPGGLTLTSGPFSTTIV
ncbi:hypothetical protein [Streptomyces longwoodensis]|uniref:hypothetical protein n=1 Tax=Streptomyces longwoodensis TaxID=68231 RepID=UPI0036E4B6EA